MMGKKCVFCGMNYEEQYRIAELEKERDKLLKQRERRIYNADLKTVADLGYPATVDRISRHVVELEAENKRLRELAAELAGDVEAYANAEYPQDLREQYPSYKSKYESAMEAANAYKALTAALQQGEDRTRADDAE